MSQEAGAKAQVRNDEGLNQGSGSADGEKSPDLRGVIEPYLLVWKFLLTMEWVVYLYYSLSSKPQSTSLDEDLLKESEQIESRVEHLPSKKESGWVEIYVEVPGFGKVSNWI